MATISTSVVMALSVALWLLFFYCLGRDQVGVIVFVVASIVGYLGMDSLLRTLQRLVQLLKGTASPPEEPLPAAAAPPELLHDIRDVPAVLQMPAAPAPPLPAPAPAPLVYLRGFEIKRLINFQLVLLNAVMLLQWFLRGASAFGENVHPLFIQLFTFVLVSGIAACILFLAALTILQLDYWNLAGDAATAERDPQAPPSRRRTILAMLRAISIIFGLNQGTVILEGGKLRRPDGRPVAAFAGPGFLDIRKGQAAILETGGVIGPVCGPGRSWLRPNQRVRGTVELTRQSITVSVEQALTQDGIPIDVFEFSMGYRVAPKARAMTVGGAATGQEPPEEPAPSAGRRSLPPPERLTPEQEDMIRELFWKDTPDSIKATMNAVGQQAVRSVVGRHYLRDLIMPSVTKPVEIRQSLVEPAPVSREDIEKEIIQDMLVVRKLAERVSIDYLSIGRITAPEPARAQLLSLWVAQQQREVAKTRAQMDLDMMQHRGEGQAQAFKAIEDAKRKIREGFIEQLAEMQARVGGKALTPDQLERYLFKIEALTTRLAQDYVRTIQVVDTLEQMGKSGKEINLYLADNVLWGRGRGGAGQGRSLSGGQDDARDESQEE